MATISVGSAPAAQPGQRRTTFGTINIGNNGPVGDTVRIAENDDGTLTIFRADGQPLRIPDQPKDYNGTPVRSHI